MIFSDIVPTPVVTKIFFKLNNELLARNRQVGDKKETSNKNKHVSSRDITIFHVDNSAVNFTVL